MKRLALPTICLAAFCLSTGTALLAQAPPPKAATGKNAPKISKGERAAVQALLSAQTDDDRIKAAEDLVTKYADTPYKSFALFAEAQAYQQKGDNAKAIVFCEDALTADPKNYDADQLMANVIAGTTKDTDLDKDQKIAKATKAANDALATVKTAEKPNLFVLSDADFEKLKNQVAAEAWQALGTLAYDQKKMDEAIKDYQTGLDLSPDPLLMLRTERAMTSLGKFDDAMAMCDKVIASPDAQPQLKTIAENDKKRIASMKK